MDSLIDALRDVIQASDAERNARERYEGYDWSYHGDAYIEDYARARDKFERELVSFIQERIREAHRPT